ncbi:MAG TPA: recombinase zinc beta ribbon domain-containing protein [Archangium sp.]|nr:recombinase zinc beta ribbon domain-containing protein [Archangium sp.]
MGRIVFQDVATLGLPVIAVMTQTSSDAPHARTLFASLGMGNDQFLQMVKAETHRGLEGRALAGFWTGGRVYGYSRRWVWNQFKWVRRPGQKSRRRVARPAHEHVIREVPGLALISKDLWDAVQNRVRRGPKPGKGRPVSTGRFTHLFSGLLRCGACNGGMGVVGQKVKAGVRYAQLGCNADKSRGDVICANKLTISEKKLVAGLLGAIQRLVPPPPSACTSSRRRCASAGPSSARRTRMEKLPAPSARSVMQIAASAT